MSITTPFIWEVPVDLVERVRADRAACHQPPLATLPETASEIQTFVNCIYAADDLVELRGLSAGTSQDVRWRNWIVSSEMSSLVEELDHRNRVERLSVVVGASPRNKRGGKAEDVALARVLFVDFDGGVNPAAARNILTKACLPEPTLIVNSGHGVHVYWRLDRPLTDLKRWTEAQKTLIARTGSDPNVFDAPRCMRLPGLYNLKYEPVPCTITAHNPTQIYPLDSLVGHSILTPPVAAAPSLPRAVVAGSTLARATLEFMALGAPRGERNQRLFAAACDMAGSGYTLDAAMEKLTKAAVDCGLMRDEVDRTLKSAFSRSRQPCIPPETLCYVEAEHSSAETSPSRPGPKNVDYQGGGNDCDEIGHAGSERVQFGNVTDQGKRRLYKPLPQIAAAARAAMCGWPRTAGGQLFVVNEFSTALPDSNVVRWIEDEAGLFAYLSTRCDVRWTNKEAFHPHTRKPANPATKAELLSFLQSTPEFCYKGIEVLPHVPSIPEIYYLPCRLPPTPAAENYNSGLTPLQQLLSKFNPDTPADRDLMLAAMLTPAWGGPPGARPTFCVTSKYGRTTGKTQTVTAIAAVWGGAIKVGVREDRDRMTSRLIDDVSRRCVLVDNIKGSLSDSDLEGAMTSDTIEGWKLFHGQASRPNLLTWFLTANTPSLSTDLVERSVVIQIGDRQHDFDFVTWSRMFIAEHRVEILAELYDILHQPSRCQIRSENRDRWVAWQNAILSKFENGNELAALIRARRIGVDSDLDEAQQVFKALRGLLVRHAHDYEQRRISITRGELRTKLIDEGIIDIKMGPKATTTYLKNLCGTGPLRYLSDKHTDLGNVWVYSGPSATPEAETESLRHPCISQLQILQPGSSPHN